MPGMYNGNDYDLAGFAVGAVERQDLLTNAKSKEGDIILGLASNGLHSNGFSLIRKVIKELDLKYEENCPFLETKNLGEALMEPTRIYVKSCLQALKLGGIGGLAHITGGGLWENPPRAFNDQLSAHIDASTWPLPPVYKWLMKTNLIAPEELAHTFNCGIGMIVITEPGSAQNIVQELTHLGETVYELGVLKNRSKNLPKVTLENIASWKN